MSPLNLDLLLFAQTSITTAEGTAEAAEAAEVSSAMGWGVFLIVVAALVIPFVVGSLLATALNLKSLSTRISLVLLAITLAVSPFIITKAEGKPFKDAIDLGIDLAGGTNMVFMVDRKAAEAEGKVIDDELMNKMVEKVKQRVNPTGTEEVTVRRVGSDRIEVIVPGADQEKVEQVKRDIITLGDLEFALLANSVNHQDIIALGDNVGEGERVFRDGKLIAMWRRPALDADGVQKVTGGDRVRSRILTAEDGTPLTDSAGQPLREFLVVVDPDPAKRITGRYLVSVREEITEKGLAVGFTFNPQGGYLFGQVTARNRPQEGEGFYSHLAVLLDGQIHSAPTINAVITTTGVIEGRFTEEEVENLLGVLNAGALEVPLVSEPVTEFTISALLGEEVQKKGFLAIGIALAAVFIFTLVYYLKSGFVADVCLAINILLVLGAMSLIDATFTLPGLAGLVLTIGMAVDANVLIFERMREEQARGSSIRMSIKNGFEKAFSTIFDANITTLLTAVVLYYIGTDQIKGFAVTLFIGILTSMFSALYIGRLIFEIAEQKRWLTDLKMMSLINAEGINFLGKKQIAAAASVLVILVGLTAVGMRGSDNLDIDFRGGSMVTFGFEGEAPETEEVRELLAPQFEDGITLEQLSVTEGGESRKLFRLRTVVDETAVVSQKIKEAFADSAFRLVQQSVRYEDPVEIVVEEGSEDELMAGGYETTVVLSESMTPAALAEEAFDSLSSIKELAGVDVEETVVARSLNPDEPKSNEIRLMFGPSVPVEDVNSALSNMKEDLEKDPHFEEVNSFAQSVTGDAKWAAITAMVISLLMIVAYLWIRFQRVTFGVAACAALIHDVLVVLGLVAIGAYLSGTPLRSILMLEDFKINLPIIAAFLTIVGYSLNDTIVVFDRIREVRGRNPALTESMVNASLNQTLSRTILTSLTTLIVVLILYVMGGEGIHGFAYCLILGILVGTYSSIYVASPVLVWLMNRQQKKVAST
ncbi:protein translocase subunit SecD [Thalassoglobus sp. JC818]|uniref:protein translocase subunit SecD n=1 Tax=Thalassoglobus sp. JC818 TaxID=3232136 RepID=UPI003458D638